MKSYFAYIRVSTVKQGEHGSSLQEQRDAISAFASRHDLKIANWFEERETAAATGRHEFARMVAALKKGKAAGVIFHKIDRSARNLKDWSAIQDLADLGFDIRFTQESINLGSNEGKLTGDFLAVIAAHYIRNLRDEVKKGIQGRLKQGLYPFRAHIGYLDQGGGKPKTPDPERAPLIRTGFELYATGRYTIQQLTEELYRLGFRSRAGKKVGKSALAYILRNPFYVGIIRMQRSGEVYPGIHEPLISKALFERVQNILDGKLIARPITHDFLYRRMITCAHCGHKLVGELQKGHVYYRCHTPSCPTRSLREDLIEEALKTCFSPLSLSEEEHAELRQRAERFSGEAAKAIEDRSRAIKLQLDAISQRIATLLDLYMGGDIEKELFQERKLALIMERKALEEEQARIAGGEYRLADDLAGYLELLKSLQQSYQLAIPAERRQLIQTITSNFSASGNELAVELKSPFFEMADLLSVQSGPPDRDRPRTTTAGIFDVLVKHCAMCADAKLTVAPGYAPPYRPPLG